MSADPTDAERAHYNKLIGRNIIAVFWEEFEGQPLPILLLSGGDREGRAATVCVASDYGCNGPGYLEHSL